MTPPDNQNQSTSLPQQEKREQILEDKKAVKTDHPNGQKELREKIKQAVHILSLYDSPFPDAQEKHIRQTQINYIRELEEQLRLQVALDSIP